MPLPSSGPISLGQINVELSLLPTAPISLNDEAVRRLLEKPSGTISMYDAYGKSDVIRYVNTAARTSVSIYALMGSPTKAGNYIFENTAEINANTGAYALRTGTFPAGSTLTIVNKGYIYGLGGAGSSSPTILGGGAGGDAIYLDMPCNIDNSNGYILAGGGGGGGASLTSGASYLFAAGGGGAGLAVGSVSPNNYSGYVGINTITPPQAGTATTGGSGGELRMDAGNITEYVKGGVGGANGAIGAVGQAGSTEQSKPPTLATGAAGAAGRAIVSNGKSLTQVAGFNSTSVKGAIV